MNDILRAALRGGPDLKMVDGGEAVVDQVLRRWFGLEAAKYEASLREDDNDRNVILVEGVPGGSCYIRGSQFDGVVQLQSSPTVNPLLYTQECVARIHGVSPSFVEVSLDIQSPLHGQIDWRLRWL